MATTNKSADSDKNPIHPPAEKCDEGIHSSRFGKHAPSICWGFAEHLKYTLGADHYNATRRDLFMALAYTVRDRIMHQWIKTKQIHFENVSAAKFTGIKSLIVYQGKSDLSKRVLK